MTRTVATILPRGTSSPAAIGRYSGLLIAVLAYFTYSNVMGIARTLVKKGDVPPLFGMWWVHLLMLAIVAVMFAWPAWRRKRAAGKQVQVLTAN